MVTNNLSNTNIKHSVFGIRHLQCFLLFLGISVSLVIRANISIAILAMTDRNSTSTNSYPEVYDWTEKTKSWIMSSFFCGYLLTQLPGGQLAHKFGGRTIAFYSITISSILTLLVPVGAHLGDWQLVCVLRLLTGFMLGILFPAVHSIISKWAPAVERGMLTTFCYTGVQFGTIFIMAISGVLASSSFGWPSIFYVSGGLGLLWSIAWYIWGASSPSDFKNITVAERELIAATNPQMSEEEFKNVSKAVPWSKIFTSPPFLVLLIAQSANNWGFVALIIEIPSYLKYIFGLDIKSNAIFSALPYLLSLILGFVFSILSQTLHKRAYFSLTTNRKLFNTISLWIPMLLLIALAYVPPDQVNLAATLLALIVGINSAYLVSWNVNHIDLSPHFSSILAGITNAFASFVGFIIPLIIGVVVNDERNIVQWRLLFFITAGVYFLGNLLYIIFGSAKTQPWNNPPLKTQKPTCTKDTLNVAVMNTKL